ncbi:MAG: hypothetical protein Q8R48_01105, partial [Candidatus Omnitrophota bacterium]|nr:hypothetical protein [Candidatus Omnitrophota bacterium]
TVMKDIVFDANNAVKDFTYTKEGATYKVINGKISESISGDGVATLYYDSGFMKSLQQQSGSTVEEYQYFINDFKKYNDPSIFSRENLSNLIFTTDDHTTSLKLAKPLLDMGDGSDGDLRLEAGQTLTIDGTKNYKSVYVAPGATLTISSWNGTNGGELILKSQGPVVIDGTLTVSGKGYRGGSGIGGQGAYGEQGESIYGTGTYSSGSNYGGGGGGRNGIKDVAPGSSAGGGGYATPGENASSSPGGGTVGGSGGAAYGDQELSNFYMGSGGGKGGAWWGASGQGGSGGLGGGKIKIVSNSVTINGTLSADGQDGSSGAAGGGGGSGGAIWIISENVAVASLATLSVKGGRGGQSNNVENSQSGNGGDGRIRIDYTNLTIDSRITTFKKQLESYTSGTFESAVIQVDALELGSLSWTQELPEGTQISFQTRTGDSSIPDTTWPDWSTPLTNSSASQITSVPKKYLQYKISLSTSNNLTPPKIIVNDAYTISFNYTKVSDNPLDSYVRVKESGITKAFNKAGVLIWVEDIAGTKTYYDPSVP